MTCSKSNATTRMMSNPLRRTLVCGICLVAIAVIALFALGGCGGSGVTPKSSVEDYTWDELSKISGEIGGKTNEGDAVDVAKKYNLVGSDGKLDGTQTKTVQLADGTQTAVQIAGFSHDDKTGGGKAGITFIFKDVITEHDMNSKNTNSGGWEGSQLRSWLATDGLAMLPKDLSSKIVAVEKKTNNTGETTSATSVTTTSDKLWLFSVTELCGTFDSWIEKDYDPILNAEGSEYKLFKDCNVKRSNVNTKNRNNILIKTYEGSPSEWWGRSPYPQLSDRFWVVYKSGELNETFAFSSDGVVPGFCI